MSKRPSKTPKGKIPKGKIPKGGKTTKAAQKITRLEILSAAIQATRDRKGNVSPEGVVKAARNPTNPLYMCFEWDDAVAAHEHRLAVARSLIREVYYEARDVTGEAVTINYWVSDPEEKKSTYMPLSRAENDARLARLVMRDELDR